MRRPSTAAPIWSLILLLQAIAASAQVATTGVGPIVMTVSDLDRAVSFYTDVLSFRKAGAAEAHLDSFDRLTSIFGTNVETATLTLGSESIQLVQYRAPRGRPVPADSRSNDEWFQHIAIVVSDIAAATARLQKYHVHQISTAPQTLPDWNKDAAGIQAFYFRDPDDHPLELIHFPDSKGDRRWHERRPGEEQPFLGIDHTAIAVASTERSLDFYRDVLGFRVVGHSLNYGVEQDHLNHVFGSRVRITSLRALTGPAVEFLEYVTPHNARPMPRDTKPNDLWSLQTTVFARDLAAALADLSQRPIRLVSGGTEAIAPLGEEGALGLMVLDPDGHIVLLRSMPTDHARH
jgi:catechol 2,3-dioxygenase-like lactoylglutathione lyase family enzyme